MAKDFRHYNVGGVIASPHDSRDYKLNDKIKRAVRLPETYIDDVEPIILDQGDVGCCVACSLAQVKHIIEYKQTGDNKAFSPMYIYGNRKAGDFIGSGMIPREAISNLVDNGTCHFEDYPGYYEYKRANKLYSKNKAVLDLKAHPFRTSSYYRLNTEDEIKTAIKLVGAVTVAYDVYEPLYYPGKDGLVNYNPNDTNIIGGHEMTIHGWTKDGYIVINSWGTSYGNNGQIIMPYDYPISECWAIIDDIYATDTGCDACE